MTSVAAEVQVYLCAKCEYWSHNKYYLKQHVDLVHNAERVYKCPFCDYAGKRSHSLKEHLVVHSNYRPYVCSQCNASFRKKGHLTNHIKMHSSYKEPGHLVCPVCTQSNFENLLGVHLHLREEHPDDIYTCNICQFATVKNAANIQMHMITHGNPKVYACNLCDFSALNEQIVSEHMSSQHSDKVSVTQSKNIKVMGSDTPVNSQKVKIWLKCTECGFITDKKDVLQDHMINKHLEVLQKKEKSADVEGKMNSNTGKVEVKLVGEPTQHKCVQCNYQTTELCALIRHMIKHRQNTTDPSCSKADENNIVKQENSAKRMEKVSFKQPYTFDESNNWYQCTICGYFTEQQRTIKAHIWKHSGHKDLDYPMFTSGQNNNVDSSATDTFSVKSGVMGSDKELKIATDSVVVNKKESENLNEVVKQEKNKKSNSEKYLIYVNSEEENCISKKEFENEIPSILRQINAVSGEYRLVQTYKGNIVNDLTVKLTKEMPNEQTDEDKHTAFEDHNTSSNIVKYEDKKDKDISFEEHTSHNESVDEGALVIDHVDVQEEVIDEGEPPLKKVKIDDTSRCHDEGVHIPDVSESCEVDTEENMVVECPPPEMAAEVSIASEPSAKASVMASSSDDDSQLSGSFDRNDAEVINLLSLLKKGPNAPLDGTLQEDDDSICSVSSSQHRQGISNSLLAVIEQLRERTHKDTAREDEEVIITSVKAPRKSKKPTKRVLAKKLNIEAIEGGYKCLSCFYTHPSFEALKIHMKLHEDKQPFECSLCDYKGKSSEDLQDHMLQHCKLRTYNCDICDATFNFKSQLRAHISAHPLTCSQCEYETSDPTGFRVHVQSHDDNTKEAPKKLYVCQKCGITFNHQEAAEAHPKTCPGLGEKSGKRVTSKRQYYCEFCPAIAHTQAILKAHMRTHDESQTLQCDLCGFLAYSVRSLKSHMKRHINDQRFVQQPLEQYKCNLCGYVCHHLPSLKSHMWRHANDKNYDYEEINAIINRALEYDGPDSEASNQEEQDGKSLGHPKYLILFRCCQCGFESVRKSTLNKHMKSHMDIIQKTLEVNQEKLVSK